MFLSFDELEESERPPKRIWLDADKMNAHFANVKRKRDDKHSDRTIEDPVQNELTAAMFANG